MKKKFDERNNEETYKDEGKHSKHVPNKHFIHEIENIHPLSIQYVTYWKDIKRKCMEGFWFEGKWMPGPLYFYINLCKIRVSKDNFSTAKTIGRPRLRDLEWEKAYVLMEARGFSGFKDDDDYTCLEVLKDWDRKEQVEQQTILEDLPLEAKKSDGSIKTYIPARHYLRKIHSKNLGKPLFQNSAYNVIDIECRGGGKSYWGANGMVLHTYCMDGVYDYDAYRKAIEEKAPYVTDILVGAIDGKYTKDLLDKTMLGMDTLVGSQSINGVLYPSPLEKKYQGSWYSGKQYIENKYEVIVPGGRELRGSGSKVYHRTFKDDPQAGNGIRISLGVIEEVGFFNILQEALADMKDTTYDGIKKFGSIYMFGTGGDMEGGSSVAAMEVFFNPRDYDCLVFQDVWEDAGDIGFFVPYEKGLNQFKDSEGNTMMEKATLFVDGKRDKLMKGKSKSPLYKEMQNNPRYPSEAFLILDSNIFPIGELKEHYNWVKSNQHDGFVKGQCGELTFKQGESTGTPYLEWIPDLHGRLTPCHFKMKKTDDTTGCIQIWEHPKLQDGKVKPFLYVAGTDPYDQDKAESTASLGSTFIYKTFDPFNPGVNEWPVAEYTARPGTAEEHHENVRKLLMYYNAQDLYENERNTLKMHFSHKHSLYLLTRTPTILKATERSKVERQYGIHMTEGIKDELEIYTRDWLLQDAGDGRLNLHKIFSLPLLQELIYYNRKGNFDRVIAFMLTICQRLNNYHIKVSEIKEEQRNMDPFFSRAFTGKFYNHG